jgi:arylsulfatase A-like enzyme
MDRQVGEVLAQLEADGLLDSTIILFYGDHGGPLPRHKRMVYDSGLRVPMIIRYPGAQRAGTRDDQLISFIDFAPTVLSVAGIEPPDYMDGYAFLGAYDAPGQRVYIHAAADRMDESYDTHRAVRDKRYKYIRYYQPDQPMYLPSIYRDQMPIMQELHRLRDAGELTEAQALWFRETKPQEELFDTALDPHELNNLADNPDYAGKLRELRAECERWVAAIDDKGLLPETELRESLWPGGEQPVTAAPEVTVEANELRIACATPGASIGYKILLPGEEEPAAWQVFTEPVALPANAIVIAVAHRIGYAPSEVQRLEVEES